MTGILHHSILEDEMGISFYFILGSVMGPYTTHPTPQPELWYPLANAVGRNASEELITKKL